MTNLEYLAKLPKNEALAAMVAHCPYHSPDGGCPRDCRYSFDDLCQTIDVATNDFALWLVAERRGEAEG